MFNYFRQLLSGHKHVQATVPATAPIVVPMNVVPAATNAAATNESVPEFSLTDSASHMLGAALAKQSISRYGMSGKEAASLPVVGVSLSSSSGRSHAISLDDNNSAPPQENVTMNVRLSRPVTDYDMKSITQAIHRVVGAIPGIAGKTVLDTENRNRTYGDIWKELKPLIESAPEAFTANERSMIEQYFTANQGKTDQVDWRQSVRVSHTAGVLNVSIKAQELPQDKNAVVSSDATLVDFFHANQATLLAKVKEKALALGVLQSHDLDALDMHVDADGWSIQAVMGTKPPSDLDPATGQKLAGNEYAKKFTETPLAKIDTKQLEKIFSEALIDCSKELPPVLPRIMDGHMLSSILHNRMGNNAQLEQFLGAHDMFKNEAEASAAAAESAKQGLVKLGEANDSSRFHDNHQLPEVSLSFDLPPGMSLVDFMASITSGRAQTGLAPVKAAEESIAALRA